MKPARRSFGKALTVLRLLVTYLIFAVLKYLLPLPRLVRLAWQRPRGNADPHRQARAIACVVRMRQLTPIADGDCLQKSLLLYRELSREGADPMLVVGFRKSDLTVEGHAWVEVAGNGVADGGGDSGAPFVPAIRFGRRGRVVTSDNNHA